jgi:hypothetical protein
MSKPKTNKSVGSSPPLVTLLRQLVVPAFEELSNPADDTPGFELVEPESGEPPFVRGYLAASRLLHVQALPFDEVRAILRINLLTGHFIDSPAGPALLVGNLLEFTPFHVRADFQLGYHGRMSVGCDLIVRHDDTAVVCHRLGELLRLADDFDWFFPLRMPTHLGWQEIAGLEIDWEDLPHHDLAGFLAEGLKVPPAERTPLTLLRLAQGLGRWQDILQLLREHPTDFPRREWASLKCMACCQLRRWVPAIRAAKEGGVRHGRFPGVKWLSPCYLLALIEGGDDIEALRVLGKPVEDEPAFYSWLRGFALHRAGDSEQAAKSFASYFATWPGDVLGAAATQAIAPDDE